MNRPLTRMARTLALCLSGPILVLACGEAPVTKGPSNQKSATVASAAPSASASAAASPEYTENDFVENENNRDPFHNYVIQTVPQQPKRIDVQLKVKLPEYSVDELKLAAIVRAANGSRAMFMPPNGVGTTVFPGEYVGRAEIVHVGGANGAEYQINWRVDKIRDDEVVLIREDRLNRSVPPATRVILLHPESTEKKG